MRPRKLVLDSEIWRFLVGQTTVTVWTPSGKKVMLMKWEVSGAPYGAHTCGDPRCTAGGNPVTPSLLKKYIEEHPGRFEPHDVIA